MANALGTLFGDIASAIREKTGDTATMKPAQFPEKIAAIEAGGGGSLVAQYQEFTATSNKQTVSHNLGTSPICAFVWPTTFTPSSATDGELYLAFAISSTIGTLLGMGTYSDKYGRYVYWNATAKTFGRGSQRYPIDGTSTSEAVFTKATTGNIVVGGTNTKLISGRIYSLWLIGYKTEE